MKHPSVSNHTTILLASLIAWILCFPGMVHAQSAVDSRLPPSVTSLKRGDVAFEELLGKVVIINFWASWCTPCIKEMPALDALQAELGEEALKVVALSEDAQAPDAESFLAKNNIKHLELFHDVGSKIFFNMGLKGMPFTIILDKKGKEAERLSGFVDWSSPEMRQKIKDLML